MNGMDKIKFLDKMVEDCGFLYREHDPADQTYCLGNSNNFKSIEFDYEELRVRSLYFTLGLITETLGLR